MLIWQQAFYELGDIAEMFYSFCWHQEILYAVHRRHKLQPPGAAIEDSFDENILSRFKIGAEGSFVLLDQTSIGGGTDPRLCAVGDQAYAYSAIAVKQQDKRTVENRIAALPQGQLQPLTLLDANLRAGKNWIPFDYYGQLAFIHSFNPLRILLCDPAALTVRVIHEGPKQDDIIAGHDNYSIFRGGSNGIKTENGWTGYGHVTLQPSRHLPFRWELSHDFSKLAYYFDLDTQILNARGYQITDPTSLFGDESNLFLAITASERDWFSAQNFSNFILPLNGDPNHPLTQAFLLGVPGSS